MKSSLETNENTFSDDVILIVGGDVQFDRHVEAPRIIYDFPLKPPLELIRKSYLLRKVYNYFLYSLRPPWLPIPYPNSEENRRLLKAIGSESADRQKERENIAQKFQFNFDSLDDEIEYPFKKIRFLFKESDISMVNLECPIADNGRRYMCRYKAPSKFIRSLRYAGVDIVSVANNHIFDAGEEGFLNTLQNLRDAKIETIGGGKDLTEARRPAIINMRGTTIAFFAYSQFGNSISDFAGDQISGISPMCLPVINEDISKVRNRADVIVISLHWGLEDTDKTHPRAVKFAHDVVDLGADIIVGHHSHVPKAVEVFKGKVIFYSLGNLIFGRYYDFWGHNILARLRLNKSGIIHAEVLPISGCGEDLYQPYPLTLNNAKSVLLKLKRLSASVNTEITIKDNIGVVKLL